MALIPGNEKVFMVDRSTNTTFSGSRATKAMQQWYTMDDVIQTIEATPIVVELPTVSVVGGAVRNVFATPIFNYLAAAYIYDLPIVGLSYPNDGTILNAVNAMPTIDVFGTVTEVTIGNIDAFVFATSQSFAAGAFTSATKITLNGLKYIYGATNSGTFTTGSSLTSVLMPDLEFATNLSFGSVSPITSFSFPKLKALVGNLSNQNVALQTISLPELLQGAIVDIQNSAIQSINLPKVKVLHQLTLTNTKASLTSIQLPVIEYCPQITFPTTSASLSTFTFGSSLKFYGSSNTAGNFITASNSLNQASVDNILISLAALNGSNGTTAFSNRTVTITGTSATPSAAGLTAKATLVSRGCTVTTN